MKKEKVSASLLVFFPDALEIRCFLHFPLSLLAQKVASKAEHAAPSIHELPDHLLRFLLKAYRGFRQKTQFSLSVPFQTTRGFRAPCQHD